MTGLDAERLFDALLAAADMARETRRDEPSSRNGRIPGSRRISASVLLSCRDTLRRSKVAPRDQEARPQWTLSAVSKSMISGGVRVN
jgi:hypothetical protein